VRSGFAKLETAFFTLSDRLPCLESKFEEISADVNLRFAQQETQYVLELAHLTDRVALLEPKYEEVAADVKLSSLSLEAKCGDIAADVKLCFAKLERNVSGTLGPIDVSGISQAAEGRSSVVNVRSFTETVRLELAKLSGRVALLEPQYEACDAQLRSDPCQDTSEPPRKDSLSERHTPPRKVSGPDHGGIFQPPPTGTWTERHSLATKVSEPDQRGENEHQSVVESLCRDVETLKGQVGAQKDNFAVQVGSSVDALHKKVDNKIDGTLMALKAQKATLAELVPQTEAKHRELIATLSAACAYQNPEAVIKKLEEYETERQTSLRVFGNLKAIEERLSNLEVSKLGYRGVVSEDFASLDPRGAAARPAARSSFVREVQGECQDFRDAAEELLNEEAAASSEASEHWQQPSQQEAQQELLAELVPDHSRNDSLLGAVDSMLSKVEALHVSHGELTYVMSDFQATCEGRFEKLEAFCEACTDPFAHLEALALHVSEMDARDIQSERFADRQGGHEAVDSLAAPPNPSFAAAFGDIASAGREAPPRPENRQGILPQEASPHRACLALVNLALGKAPPSAITTLAPATAPAALSATAPAASSAAIPVPRPVAPSAPTLPGDGSAGMSSDQLQANDTIGAAFVELTRRLTHVETCLDNHNTYQKEVCEVFAHVADDAARLEALELRFNLDAALSDSGTLLAPAPVVLGGAEVLEKVERLREASLAVCSSMEEHEVRLASLTARFNLHDDRQRLLASRIDSSDVEGQAGRVKMVSEDVRVLSQRLGDTQRRTELLEGIQPHVVSEAVEAARTEVDRLFLESGLVSAPSSPPAAEGPEEATARPGVTEASLQGLQSIVQREAARTARHFTEDLRRELYEGLHEPPALTHVRHQLAELTASSALVNGNASSGPNIESIPFLQQHPSPLGCGDAALWEAK